MQFTFVTNDRERREYRRVIDAYSSFASGKMSKEEYGKLPRNEWIDVVLRNDGLQRSFLVVDNRTGDCWVEEFDTLDGAILYATDVVLTPDGSEDFDYEGAAKMFAPLDQPCAKRKGSGSGKSSTKKFDWRKE